MNKNYTEQISKIRSEVMTEIKTIMERHNGVSANFVENGGYCPTLRDDSDEDSIYTLDRVVLGKNGNVFF